MLIIDKINVTNVLSMFLFIFTCWIPVIFIFIKNCIEKHCYNNYKLLREYTQNWEHMEKPEHDKSYLKALKSKSSYFHIAKFIDANFSINNAAKTFLQKIYLIYWCLSLICGIVAVFATLSFICILPMQLYNYDHIPDEQKNITSVSDPDESTLKAALDFNMFLKNLKTNDSYCFISRWALENQATACKIDVDTIRLRVLKKYKDTEKLLREFNDAY